MNSVNDILKSNLNDIKKLDEFLKLENVNDAACNDFCTDSGDSDDSDEDYNVLEFNILNDNVIEGNFDRNVFDSKVNEILNLRNIHESVLALNKLQQFLLRHHINKFENLLVECRKKRKLIKEQISLEATEKNRKSPNFYKLGVPFFKDENFRFPPPNSDYIKKKQNNEISLVDLPFSKLWIKKDKEILLDEVQLQSKQIKIDIIKGKMQPLIALYKTVKDKNTKSELKTKIDTLQAELLLWQKKKPSECIFSLEEKDIQIDWLKIAATDLADRHEDDECKAMWYMYLHPSINKSSWGVKENEKLREIAEKYNYQDWDTISKSLGTNRSGYQCCLQFQLKMKKKNSIEKWTSDEDNYLLEVVDSCRIGNYIPWGKVSYYMKGRTKGQVYTRYAYTLLSGIKKGKFTKTEDAKLLSLVKEYGTNFSRIAIYLPNRTPVQLRDRYKMTLQFEKKTSGTWSVEEDRQIVEHVKQMGETKWSVLFEKFQSKIARNRANLRHRWLTLKKFLDKNPDADLENAPRKYGRKNNKNNNKKKVVSDLFEETNYKTDVCNLIQKYSKDTFQVFLGKKCVHFFLQTYKFIKFSSRMILNLDQDVEHIIFVFRCIHVNLNLNSMKEFLNSNSNKTSEYDRTLFFMLYSKLETMWPLMFINTSSDDLLSLTPKSFFNMFSIQNFIFNSKLLLKFFEWFWYDSELENYCIKVNGKYSRIFDSEKSNSERVKLKQTFKSNVSDTKFAPSVENKSLTNSVIKVECQQDSILNDNKFTILNKQQNEDMFKRRCISFFTLSYYFNFIVEILREYDTKKKLNQCDVENNKQDIDEKKIKRKRGRPMKVLPGKKLKYRQKDNTCSNLGTNHETV